MYFVYKYINKKNELLYVGQTIDLDRRFNEHKNRIWDIEKEKILYAECKTIIDMNIYEMFYINKLKPKYNTALVFNDLPSFDLPELEWKEYNKNHIKENEEKIKNNFKEEVKRKFEPNNFWKNKIKQLGIEFEKETDFVKKKEILEKIRKCKEKIKDA